MEIVRWLATKGGGDPTIPTGQGAAPLHVATIAGQLEVVKYLYQFGSATAFGGLRSSDGTSALHFAAASGEEKKGLPLDVVCTVITPGCASGYIAAFLFPNFIYFKMRAMAIVC